MRTTIGFLRKGDFFLFEGRKYRVGSLIEKTNGYIACVDVETKKVKRLYIDTTVEVDSHRCQQHFYNAQHLLFRSIGRRLCIDTTVEVEKE